MRVPFRQQAPRRKEPTILTTPDDRTRGIILSLNAQLGMCRTHADLMRHLSSAIGHGATWAARASGFARLTPRKHPRAEITAFIPIREDGGSILDPDQQERAIRVAYLRDDTNREDTRLIAELHAVLVWRADRNADA